MFYESPAFEVSISKVKTLLERFFVFFSDKVLSFFTLNYDFYCDLVLDFLSSNQIY